MLPIWISERMIRSNMPIAAREASMVARSARPVPHRKKSSPRERRLWYVSDASDLDQRAHDPQQHADRGARSKHGCAFGTTGAASEKVVAAGTTTVVRLGCFRSGSASA